MPDPRLRGTAGPQRRSAWHVSLRRINALLDLSAGRAARIRSSRPNAGPSFKEHSGQFENRDGHRQIGAGACSDALALIAARRPCEPTSGAREACESPVSDRKPAIEQEREFRETITAKGFEGSAGGAVRG